MVDMVPGTKSVDVETKLWNAHSAGTPLGGSLHAMTDPFYILMLMQPASRGRDGIAWDKAASIRDRRPGRGKVRAESGLTDAQLDDIREKLKALPKYELAFTVEVKDEHGTVIAQGARVLHLAEKGIGGDGTSTGAAAKRRKNAARRLNRG